MHPRIWLTALWFPLTWMTVDGRRVRQDLQRDCYARYLNCIGFGKEDCVTSGTCDYILGFQDLQNESRIGIEMFSDLRPKDKDKNRYIALGFSRGPMMGDDGVVGCVHYGSTTEPYLSFNSKYKNLPAFAEEASALKQLESYYSDGQIYCNFTLPYEFTVRGMKFNLVKTPYMLLFASGRATGARTLTHQGSYEHYASTERIIVGSVTGMSRSYEKAAKPLGRGVLITHIVFLTFPYLCLIPTGMLIARYLKESHINHEICETRPWFPLHTGLQVVSILLLLVGQFVIAFSSSKSKTKSPKRTVHLALGIIATIILIMNAAAGCFRGCVASSLSHRGKVVFGLLHWAGAYLSWTLGVVQILITPLLLPSDIRSCTMPFVLVGSAAGLYLLTYVVLALLMLRQDYDDEKTVSRKIHTIRDSIQVGDYVSAAVQNLIPGVLQLVGQADATPAPEETSKAPQKSILKKPKKHQEEAPPVTVSNTPSTLAPEPVVGSSKETMRENRLFGMFRKTQVGTSSTGPSPMQLSSAASQHSSHSHTHHRRPTRKITWKQKKQSHFQPGQAHFARPSQMTLDTVNLSSEPEHEIFYIERIEHDYFELVFALDDEDTDDEWEWSKWRSVTHYPLKPLAVRETSLTLVYDIVIACYFLCSAALCAFICYILVPDDQFRGNCVKENME